MTATCQTCRARLAEIRARYEDPQPHINKFYAGGVQYVTVRVDDLEWLLRSLDQSIISIDKFDATNKELKTELQTTIDDLEGHENDLENALVKIEELKANQRTPGKTEVCENHVYPSCRNHAGGWRLAPCNIKPCPLKDQP